ncbi:GNAT family N-acetyltransferase [Thermomonospora umbrina]|uniref:RimJ/RimL family protein N-acetyltransferase n=1 Tax=Thermomonospora umbrina TaxID=111806 RepID=A0A3D9SFZ3_9ACTN|nr:GNAT family N-acetyltransferase [Thermomonospora umbrina]REE94822.1 RimJ/RimL family protein N-acetyltransferase [Thermomonospora umbrina]
MGDLTTRRLVLEAWRERHASDLRRMSADERVMYHLGPGAWSAEYAARRHVRALRHWAEHGFGWRAIRSRADRAFLGLVSLGRPSTPLEGVAEPALEIGWCVEPAAWGRGIATEAAAAMVAEAFERVGAETVIARYRPDNIGSARVAAKIGLRTFTDLTEGDDGPVRVAVVTRADPRHLPDPPGPVSPPSDG